MCYNCYVIMRQNKESEKKMIRLKGIPANIDGDKIIMDKEYNFAPMTLLEYLHSLYISYQPSFKSAGDDIEVIEKIAKKYYGDDLKKAVEDYDKKCLDELYLKAYGG